MLEVTKRELVWTPEMTRRFWAHESQRPEIYFSFAVNGVLVSRFRRFLHGDVADFGAGSGMLIEDLVRSGVRTGAIEHDDAQISQLVTRFGQSKLFLGARTVADLGDWANSFDAVFMVELIEHLYDADLERCMQSAIDLLKPGGVLIITTPNNEDRDRSMICSPETGALFHRWQHVRSWDAASLQAMIRRFDLSTIEIGETDFNTSLAASRRTRSWLLRALTLPIRMMRSRGKPHLYVVAGKPAANH